MWRIALRIRHAEGELLSGLRSRSSILWLNGPGGTPTSSFKFRVAKQAFTFAILTLCTPHLRTAVHLCNRTEVPVPYRKYIPCCIYLPGKYLVIRGMLKEGLPNYHV